MTTPDLGEPLAGAVVITAGQPATVRVGNINSITPVRVEMGGTLLEPAAVGFARDYAPVLGDVVALLGQSVEGADTSGSTWLVLGAISPGASNRNELNIVAAKQRATGFDSPTYTVAAGEQLIGGNINLTVPLKAGHLFGLHITFHHANTSGVGALTTVAFRETSLAGAVAGAKNFVPGAGNSYVGGRLDVWVRPTTTRDQLYVVTTRAIIAGTGQWGFATSDLLHAVDYGLAANVPLV